MSRNKKKLPFFSPYRYFSGGDHIIIKANPEDLREFLDVTGFELTASKKLSREDLRSDEISVVEAVVNSNSLLEGQTARTLNLRSAYGINLLGISRQGARLNIRPDQVRFRAGDVLLLQGRVEVLRDVMSALGCLPLVERGLRLGQPRRILLSIALFGAALISTSAGLLPIQVAFMIAAVGMLFAGFLSLREVYESIDWPVIVLLGAMIPVSRAMETTGGAETIGRVIYSLAGEFSLWTTLTIVMIITILLSNVVNNAAAALLMAPIALSIAGLECFGRSSPDDRGNRSLKRFSYPDWASVQHACYGPGGLPLWGLLANGPSPDSDYSCDRRAFNYVRLASLIPVSFSRQKESAPCFCLN
jgi:hypothetical protein